MNFKKTMMGVVASTFCILSMAQAVQAAPDFPSRPINIIVPWGTGGGSDQLTRNWVEAAKEVAPDISFNITNMPGANGLVGLNHVMSQPADGYVIYQIVTLNYLLDSLSGASEFELSDIDAVAAASGAKDMLYINSADDRFDDWDGVVAFAKENPGKLRMAVSSLSGLTKASAGEMLKTLDLDITLVPYPKPAERFGALLGRHADLLFQRVSDVATFLEAEKFKPVIAFSEERMADFPDVPTTVEKGAPESTLTIIRGLAMKSGIPEDRLEIIRDVFARASETERFQKYLKLQSSETVYVGEDFKELLEGQLRQLGSGAEG